MSPLRDYDAFVAEDEPIIVHVLGQDWEVPRSPRADHMAMLQRSLVEASKLQAKIAAGREAEIDIDSLDGVSMTDTVSVAEVLAGAEIVAEWLAGGIRESQLKAIVADLFAEQQPELAKPGKTKAGKRPPAPSSTTGRSSKRTSVESTESTT